MAQQTELRIELPAAEVAVLDGYCQATGKSRSGVLRELLQTWSEQKHHEATVILRVAGHKPAAPECTR